VTSDQREFVRAVIAADYRPFDDSTIRIVREKQAGKDAAFAVAFEDRDGVQRRGLIGLCRHHKDTWRPSGGFMGSAHVTGDRDVWMTRGGWGSGDSHERSVTGGWAADPTAVAARLVDSTGRTLTDTLENGVFLFMWRGDLNVNGARLELLDDDGHVTRSGPMRRRD
jgi:hypothetical protein